MRPFIIEGIHLKDTGIHPQDEAGVEKYLAEKVASMIDSAAAEYEGNDKRPLVRLKVRKKWRYGKREMQKRSTKKKISVYNLWGIIGRRGKNIVKMGKKQNISVEKKKKKRSSQPLGRFELPTPGLQDQCSNH